FFDGSVPNLAIADGDLLKTVLVKEFSNFQNRRKMPAVFGPIIDKMLTDLVDDEWKTTRNVMTQAFTSGKIKRMMESLNMYNNTLLEKMGERADADDMFEFKDLVGKCTLDIVAAIGFGIDAQVQNNPKSEFITHSAEFSQAGFFRVAAGISMSSSGYLKNSLFSKQDIYVLCPKDKEHTLRVIKFCVNIQKHI
ncbi:unnamed protein product, partial [Owenia fusiformis]